MKIKRITTSVKDLSSTLQKATDQINLLNVLLKEETIVETIIKKKWKSISINKLQREFSIGYSTSRLIINRLIKNKRISSDKTGQNFNIKHIK